MSPHLSGHLHRLHFHPHRSTFVLNETVWNNKLVLLRHVILKLEPNLVRTPGVARCPHQTLCEQCWSRSSPNTRHERRLAVCLGSAFCGKSHELNGHGSSIQFSAWSCLQRRLLAALCFR
ncbi:unnamed protein product [Ixodes pacificus]